MIFLEAILIYDNYTLLSNNNDFIHNKYNIIIPETYVDIGPLINNPNNNPNFDSKYAYILDNDIFLSNSNALYIGKSYSL